MIWIIAAVDWTTLGVGVLAALAAIGGNWSHSLTAKAQRKHEHEMAEAAREKELEAQKTTYQVETMLELQLALQRYARASAAVHLADLLHHRQTGEPWGQQSIDEARSVEAMEAGIVVRLLVARVRDADVRAIAERAHEALDLVRAANDERTAKAAMEEGLDAFQQALEAIGRALRGLPAPTQYRPLVTTPFSPADRPSNGNR